jgi:hypothetical protein
VSEVVSIGVGSGGHLEYALAAAANPISLHIPKINVWTAAWSG